MALASPPPPVQPPGGHGGTVAALAVAGGAVASALAFREALVALRRSTVGTLGLLWGLVTVADLSRSLAAFGEVGAVLVDRAQRRAVALADLFGSAALGMAPTGLDPAPFVGPSVPVPMSAVLSVPPAVSVRMAIAQGLPEEAALARGRYRAARIAQTEVQRAATDALAAVAAPRSTGWRRQLGPTPCPICEALATGEVQPWSEAAAIALHPLCSCVPAVVVG